MSSPSTDGKGTGPSRSFIVRNERSKVSQQAQTIVSNYNFLPSGRMHSDGPKIFPGGRRECFVGRKSDLERLQNFLEDTEHESDEPRRKIILVQGGIGYGKTQLCLNFAYKNRNRFHCWLIPAGSHTEIRNGFQSICMDLSQAFEEDHGTLQMIEHEHRVNYAKRLLTTHSQWMLIFDNANSEIDYERDYFPDTPDGIILINGRQQQLQMKVKGLIERTHILKPLSTAWGIDLFKRLSATRENVGGESDASKLIRDIVLNLDGIPLAIELAVAKIGKLGRQKPLLERLKEFKQDWDDLFRGRSTREVVKMQATQVDQLLDILDLGSTDRHDLSRVHGDASSLLETLSCLGSEPLSTRWLENSWKSWKIARSRHDPDYRSYPDFLKDHEAETFAKHSIQKAISLLDSLCLIQIIPDESHSEFTFVTFVKSCILDRTRSKRLGNTLSALTMLLQPTRWDDDLDQYTHAMRLLPHLRGIFEMRDEAITSLAAALLKLDGLDAGLESALKIGTIQFLGGCFRDAEAVQKYAVSSARYSLGVYHTMTLRTMSELATTYMILDQPTEALKLREEVYQIRGIICQRQLSFRFAASCVLSNVYLALRSQRLPTWRTVGLDFCGNPFARITTWSRFGWICKTTQKNTDVRLRNSLAYQQISMNLADSLAAIPGLEAKEQALRIRRGVAYQRVKTVGPNPATENLQRRIEATRKVASSLRDLRQYSKSFHLRKKIYVLCQQEQCQRHWKYPVLFVRVMGELAESYMDLGNSFAALELSQDVSDTLKQLVERMSLPENHVQVILAERDLGHKHRVMANLHIAQELYEDVEKKCLKLFGAYHRLSIDAAENVALVKSRQGNFDGELERQRAVIAKKHKLHSSQSEELLNSLELLATILLNKQSAAHLGPKLQYYVINTRNRQHHRNEISILESLNHLANCLTYSDEGHYLEVEESECKLCHEAQYVRSQVLFRQASHPSFGINHTDTLTTMSGLADDYDLQCKIHMRPDESLESSQSASQQPKVSFSISGRDASNSSTRVSDYSSKNELGQEVFDDWKLFLKDDRVDPSVFERLATDIPLEPIVSVHKNLHISSNEVLKSRSLALREHVLRATIANGRVVATKNKDGKDWEAENRLVCRAERKLAESRSLYAGGHKRHRDRRISGWLEYVDSDGENPEIKLPPSRSPSPNFPNVSSDAVERSDDDTESDLHADVLEDK